MMEHPISSGDSGVGDVDDLEPQPRDRCNTWPLQKPVGDLSHHTSPLIHEEIPEEGRSAHGSGENLGAAGEGGDGPDAAGALATGGVGKKNTARRNAWGNLSYADLITQAILSAPEKRLTLSQIYDWMVQNVPYFRDKGDSNSSAGWKNSIRHNLSLHNRFMRIQNEGAGKSSWWVINPDAKPGKSSRRRAGSMEQGGKLMEKKRGRAKKKADQLHAEAMLAAPGQPHHLSLSPSVSDSSEHLYGEPSSGFSLSPGEFRARSDSNLSNYSLGSACQGRLSPQLEEIEDWDVSERVGLGQAPPQLGPQELFSDLIESISLGEPQPASAVFSSPTKPPPPYGHTPPGGRPLFHLGRPGQQAPAQPQAPQQANGHHPSPHPSPLKEVRVKMSETCAMAPSQPPRHPSAQTPAGSGAFAVQQLSPNGFVKEEPPAYQELYPASVQTISSNPMLRDALQKAQQQQQQQQPQPQLLPLSQQANYPPNCAGQFYVHNGHGPGQLPTELSEINYYDALKSDIQCDIDQVIRHELSVAGKLDFNMDGIGNL